MEKVYNSGKKGDGAVMKWLYLVGGIFLLSSPLIWYFVSDNFNPRIMFIMPVIGLGFLIRYFKIRSEGTENDNGK